MTIRNNEKMIEPKIPENELERLRDLNSYSILDTLPESEYEEITKLAAMICQVPIALISLIDNDRQWFKSHFGINVSETPRSLAFCAHAINHPNEVLAVPDARLDERFKDNPLVTSNPSVTSYTGVPLVSTAGYPLGTLCVIDTKPKEMNNEQIEALKALSNQVIRLFELRKSKALLEAVNLTLEQKNYELDQFARIAAHDLKSPLASISSLVSLLKENENIAITEESKEILDLMEQSSESLRNLVDGILEHSRSEKYLEAAKEDIHITKFFEDTIQLFKADNVFIDFPVRNKVINANKTALSQIFINLISNSIKYNDKDFVNIELEFNEGENEYEFCVKDNGIGIAKENLAKIFNIFEIMQEKDRFGNRGNGIGLSTVKKLITGIGGKITVSSNVGKGTKICFTIPQ